MYVSVFEFNTFFYFVRLYKCVRDFSKIIVEISFPKAKSVFISFRSLFFFLSRTVTLFTKSVEYESVKLYSREDFIYLG